MHKFTKLLSLLLVLIASARSQDAINSAIQNRNVERTIDISSQLVKINTKISVENTGKSAVKSYLCALTDDEKSHLAFIGAWTEGKSSQLTVVETTVSGQGQKGLHFYKVEFNTPLNGGQSMKIEMEATLIHALQPYPSHITQAEKQLVIYTGNHYLISPYSTRSQTTTVTLASSSVESYSKLKPVSQAESTITYGPYENVPPFNRNVMSVHYENNNPFLTITNLERSIEVSHWGVIAIEEVIDVRHTGAIIKGSFSRYDYQRDQNGASSVKSFRTILPASAVDVYYRDEIGNISTSHLRVLDDSVEVDIRPRFPLFGGWKTHYILGYYVPTYEYLYNSEENYVLKMRFVDHIFDDSIVEQATVKIILPEGAKDIKLKTPYPVVRQKDQRHYTYLDTIGRPVIIVQKSNLVEHHIQDFEVHYSYKKILMLQEPLLVVVALYLLFLLVIFYVRLDFTISRDPEQESKLQASGLVEKILSHHDKRTEIYSQYDAAFNKYKSSKDSAGYQAALKKLNTEYKTENQAITDYLNKLKQDGPESAEAISELQRLDRSLKEQFQAQMTLIEKLMAGKMSKQQFVETEGNIKKKKEELAEKMQTITAAL